MLVKINLKKRPQISVSNRVCGEPQNTEKTMKHIWSTHLSDRYSLDTRMRIIAKIEDRAKKIKCEKEQQKLLDKIQQSIFVITDKDIVLMVYYINNVDYIEYPIGHISALL